MSGNSIFFGQKGLRKQEYNSPGSYSFQVPVGVRNMFVTVVGGGGAGGAAVAGAGNGAQGGGGGGITQALIDVTPGEFLSITVGAGGVAPAFPIAPPAGTDSRLVSSNNNIFCGGGGAGNIGNNGSYFQANNDGGFGLVTGGQAGQRVNTNPTPPPETYIFVDAETTPYAVGGTSSDPFGSQGGATGGGASLGAGGNAGDYAADSVGNATSGVRGGGGGGGQNGGAGGNGGNGLVHLAWVQPVE